MPPSKMDLSSFYPDSLEIQKIEEEKERWIITLKSRTQGKLCPKCQCRCREYHSTYRRRIQDLPILGKSVQLHLVAYRYNCSNVACPQKVFCEPIDGLCGHYKRITARLEDFLIGLAIHTNCEGAARVANLIGIQISGDTIIRILKKKAESIEPEKTDMIGVDDWAYKKGATYGTIIVDGRTHKPIDLLEGRDGEVLKKWLEENKQVKIVTRDRASAYAAAVKEVLPEAMQVADRFHLHQNLLEAIRKVSEQELPAKIKIYHDDVQEPEPLTSVSSQSSPKRGSESKKNKNAENGLRKYKNCFDVDFRSGKSPRF